MFYPESKSPTLRYEESVLKDEVSEAFRSNQSSVDYITGNNNLVNELPDREILFGIIDYSNNRAPLTIERSTFKNGSQYTVLTVNGEEYFVLEDGIIGADESYKLLDVDTVMKLRFWLSNTYWILKKYNLSSFGENSD